MAEEATSTETQAGSQQDAPQIDMSLSQLDGADIVTDLPADDGADNQGDAQASLFGEEAPSIDDLTGESDGDDSNSESGDAGDDNPDDKSSTADKDSGTAGSEDDKGTDTSKDVKPEPEDAPADDGKPPKGFVPHAALQEERNARKQLSEKVQQLENLLLQKQNSNNNTIKE